MKIGLVFESILKRGLLEFTSTLPNRAPEFRYAYHEIIEEAQHSLMFQEFVNRSPHHRAQTTASLAKVRALCTQLGLTGRPYGVLWSLLRVGAAGAAG